MNLTCLIDQGVITQAQANQLAKLLTELPAGESDLLKIIVATGLVGEDVSLAPVILGVESITVNNVTAEPLIAIPEGATKAMATVYANAVYFRVDGGVPAVSVGHYAAALSTIEINNLANFQVIAAAGSATIYLTYY
jgi:hypothetical protein